MFSNLVVHINQRVSDLTSFTKFPLVWNYNTSKLQTLSIDQLLPYKISLFIFQYLLFSGSCAAVLSVWLVKGIVNEVTTDCFLSAFFLFAIAILLCLLSRIILAYRAEMSFFVNFLQSLKSEIRKPKPSPSSSASKVAKFRKSSLIAQYLVISVIFN